MAARDVAEAPLLSKDGGIAGAIRHELKKAKKVLKVLEVRDAGDPAHDLGTSQGDFTLAEHPLPMGRSALIGAVTAVCGLRGGRQLAGSRPGLAIRAIESGLEP